MAEIKKARKQAKFERGIDDFLDGAGEFPIIFVDGNFGEVEKAEQLEEEKDASLNGKQ